jgi:unsaturated rhamnogalacturonyl hydrolase
MQQRSNADLKAWLSTVAAASLYYPEYRYKAWGYGEWIAMEGLLDAAELCGDARFQGFVEGLISGWISKRSQLTPADHVSPGVTFLRLYQITGQEVYLDRALALAKLLLDSPRSSRGARLLRPDANTHVYVDCLYSDPPLFCKLGLATGDRRWFAEAAEYAREFWDVLVDPEVPLLYHGYSETTHSHIGLLWGRGVGWALLGLVDTLENLPAETAGREGILANVRNMSATLKELQAENGHWHTVLNRPESYLENSIAAFLFTSFRKAMRLGLLDGSFAACTLRAWNAFSKAVQPNGQMLVSEATPEGDLASYQALKLGIYPWGQGPVLRAISEELAARGATN